MRGDHALIYKSKWFYKTLLRGLGIFIFILLELPASGQKDTSAMRTKDFYRNVEHVSSGSKVFSQFYRLFFRPLSKQKKPKKEKPLVDTQTLLALQCLPVGDIIITVYDPFGYSLQNRHQVPHGLLPKAGNFLHNKTNDHQVLNLLMVQSGDEFDTLLISESERLLRSQSFIRDAVIIPAYNDTTKKVDLEVRVLDNWSLIISGSLSETASKINLTERNFGGWGHTFDNSYKWVFNRNADELESSYMIPNLFRTYLNAKVLYRYSDNKGELKSFNLERLFYSPQTRYAGGLLVEQNYVKMQFPEELNLAEEKFKYNHFDMWGGRAIKFIKGLNAYQRQTKLITTARISSIQYLSFPSSAFDTLGFYKNENLYLAGIGFSTRQYSTEQYVFKYGQTEDIPLGRVYSATIGYREKLATGNWYAGLKAAFGDFYSFGYLGTAVQYGTFFYKGNSRNAVLKIKSTYFTPVKEVGNWKLRQFIMANTVLGIDRLDNEFVSFNDEIYGFDDRTTGTKKLFLSLQTQSYAPVDFYGFRIGPYLVASAGWLGNQATGFKKSKMYSLFGLGLIIRNDYLAISSFQISLAYFPVVPYKGTDLLRLNPLRSTDFRLIDFDIEKPEIVSYN